MPASEDEAPPQVALEPAGALLTHRVPPTTRAAVLFLHGGRSDSRAPSRPWHPAAVRMRPVVRAVAAAVPDDDVLLGTVRYRVRGWNQDAADPLRDARRALAELARLVGDVPVVLVGHSMGGRAALRAASAPRVRSVVALAPWCPAGEPVAHLRDKGLVVVHGDRDRVTDPRASATYVRRALRAGARARFLPVAGGDHAMLRHSGTWHRTTGSAVAGLLAVARGPA
ncbi:alpha/beta fold hydrolase [Streptomyces sp. NPDC014882]|uniref:alpha/beta fold hydrolase n=1 Tax=Streptomyces sp. NPDC014882 TaxID=3364927 RepID=UPI003701A245